MKTTQQNIADAIGYSQPQINRVLNGVVKPSVKLAKLLESYTGMHWTEWFEDDYSPQTQRKRKDVDPTGDI